jgi:hypothetical protein
MRTKFWSETPRNRWEDNIKSLRKKLGVKVSMSGSYPVSLDPMVGPCEHDDEFSGSRKFYLSTV